MLPYPPAGRLGGHGRGVMQRGITGALSPAGLSQSNSTSFHSAGESNDARRHLNRADLKDVFSPEKPHRTKEPYSPANLALPNEMFGPLNVAV
jgi:hypothetical protein